MGESISIVKNPLSYDSSSPQFNEIHWIDTKHSELLVNHSSCKGVCVTVGLHPRIATPVLAKCLPPINTMGAVIANPMTILSDEYNVV